jgi:hypothetical protein
MIIERLLNNNIEVIPLGILIFIAIVTLVLKITANKDFLTNVKAKKAKQLELLEYIQNTLDTIGQRIEYLNNDLAVISQFNKKNTSNIKEIITKSHGLYSYLELLENTYISARFKNYIEGVTYVVEEIDQIEDFSYKSKAKYQTNAQEIYSKYHERKIDSNEYVDLLNAQREIMETKQNSLNADRERLYHELNTLSTEKEVLQSNMQEYYKKSIEHKKFYPRYMSFA